jgi:hypothetical protein
MFSHLVRTLIAVAVGSSFLVGAVACMQPAARKSKKPDSGDYFEEDDYVYEEEEDPEETVTILDNDAGVISVPTRPSDGGADVKKPTGTQPCPATFAEGDLRVVEFMITSKEGTGDVGEWVEIRNTRDCIVNVRNVKIESPRGSTSIDSVTVEEDIVLQPWGTFIVASNADPALNGGLPAPVVAFLAASGAATSDVLKNDGDSIKVIAPDGTQLDRLVYPDIRQQNGTRPYGISYALPWNCDWAQRMDPVTPDLVNTVHWSLSDRPYGAGGRKGTPNADNDDVSCY